MIGKAYLIGAGPGDPELLTLKALRILQRADVVLHDDLVAPETLALVPLNAQVYNVGKRCGRKAVSQDEINALMVAYAKDGLTVVRLKGGDPVIFGRAGEEMESLYEAGLDFEVIPGVTAALSAAAAARIPLTDRRKASAVIFATGHRCAGKAPPDWQAIASLHATIVVYMPGDQYDNLIAGLCGAGWSHETPCVIVSCAATPREQIYRTTLGNLSQAPQLPAPILVILGTVAKAFRRLKGESNESEGLLPTAVCLKNLGDLLDK